MWTKIFESPANDVDDMVGEIKDALTLNVSYMNLIKYEDRLNSGNYWGKELVLEKNGKYLNLASAVGRSAFDYNQSSVGVTDPDYVDTLCAFSDVSYSSSSDFRTRANRLSGGYNQDQYVIKTMPFNGFVEKCEIFKHSNHDSFMFIFEISPNVFFHLYFGEVFEPNSGFNGDISHHYFDCTNVSTASGLWNYSNSRYDIIFGQEGLFYNSNENKFIISGEYDDRGNAEDLYSREYRNLACSTPWSVNSFSNRGREFLTYGIDASWRYTAYSPLFGSKTRFNNKHIPLPLNISCKTYGDASYPKYTENLVYMAAYIPDLNYICYNTIEIKETIAFGDRNVICYPFYTKMIPVDVNGDDLYLHYFSGISMRTS